MTHESQTLKIASTALSAEIATLGAELQNLSDADGRRLQWDGDPTIWAGRAPLLFPVIGMLQGNRYRLDGRDYAMPKHGFARHSHFDVVSHEEDAALLRLSATAETRAIYPFEFQLDVAYTLTGAKLRMVATVSNPGDQPMPASFGFHPAFRWPLPYGEPRADHGIRFEHDEPAPIRRLDRDGFLTADLHPTPVIGNRLALDDTLFDDDAVIFDQLSSRRVSYGASRGPRLDIRFDGLPMLGVWTKPGGAQFICIEPWQGMADPVGFDDEIWKKPGIVVVAPGGARVFGMTVGVEQG